MKGIIIAGMILFCLLVFGFVFNFLFKTEINWVVSLLVLIFIQLCEIKEELK